VQSHVPRSGSRASQMDGRRPRRKAWSQNPAYRPTHPPSHQAARPVRGADLLAPPAVAWALYSRSGAKCDTCPLWWPTPRAILDPRKE
jgi:hypothetical protein